ncbi:hypothetical protein HDU93_001864 [Gonapodya sp. JEL0774]|nr:hypothetical protein HDU93_001864 [Gonapodya sp. JEL0774]
MTVPGCMAEIDAADRGGKPKFLSEKEAYDFISTTLGARKERDVIESANVRTVFHQESHHVDVPSLTRIRERRPVTHPITSDVRAPFQ